MPAAAVIGAAAIGAGGSIIASSNNKKAIAQSTDSSLQAQREALAAQQRAFDTILPLQQNALNQSISYQRDALGNITQLQGNGYNNSGQALTQAYNNATGALNPYMQTGYAANNGLNALLGLPQQQAYTPQQATFKPISIPQMPAAQQPTAPVPTSPGANLGPSPQPTNALMAPPRTETARATEGRLRLQELNAAAAARRA